MSFLLYHIYILKRVFQIDLNVNEVLMWSSKLTPPNSKILKRENLNFESQFYDKFVAIACRHENELAYLGGVIKWCDYTHVMVDVFSTHDSILMFGNSVSVFEKKHRIRFPCYAYKQK